MGREFNSVRAVKPSTYFAKKETAERNWVLIDLKDQVLGRAASQIANILRGKNKPQYTPHVDTGDFIVAINVDRVKLTGKKESDKIYYHHTGYPGGIKAKTAGDLRKKHPSMLLQHAVKSMLPKNKMNKHLMKKLKIYEGTEHPHQAQQPKTVEIH